MNSRNSIKAGVDVRRLTYLFGQATGAKRSSGRSLRAFTLLELLVVIAIIGILATIAAPALKGLGGSNDIAAANRQLIDDLSFARLRAINDRTTVYVVFASPDILHPAQPWNNVERVRVAKMANLQYTGYALFAKRMLGDQPGPGTAHYLTEWRSLPDGVFIPTNKFDINVAAYPQRAALPLFARPFFYEDIPFPTATDKVIKLPCVAFNYQGKLTQMEDFVLPISKGSLIYPQESRDAVKKQSLEPAEVIETPRGNSTNNPILRIDWLTGRARIERPENVNYAAAFSKS
jgi:prepilin-type N-terminal cleavage/methylation domain-containing protein